MGEREKDFKQAIEDKEIEEKHSNSQWGDFKIFNKKISEIYSNDDALSLRTDHKAVSREIFRITSKAILESRIQNAYEDPYIAAEISKGLFNLDANYAKIIMYYATMHLIRYVIIPTEPLSDGEKTIDDAEYLRIYNEMTEVIDGANLEIMVPNILKEIYTAGSAYVYAVKNNSAKTISFLMLPTRYSRTVLQTTLGTNLIEFNFEYFDQFRTEETLNAALSVFPKEFSSKYNEVRTQNNKWLPLDPKYSTSFMINERGMPPFINALASILEYEDYRDKEKTKNDNELKSIFINQIPVWEDKPLFDLTEMKAVHAGLKRILRSHDGLQPVSVFGKSELVNLQKTGEKENKVIDQSYKTIYNSVGVNPSMVIGNNKESIELMKSVDQASAWDLINNINNFINVAVNNLYRFKPLQAEISILPITVSKEQEIVKNYRENAAYGIGKLEAIVASGIKQKHIRDRARLEKTLDLDSLLKPLQSSHTQGGGTLNSVTAEAGNGDSTDENTGEGNQDEE